MRRVRPAARLSTQEPEPDGFRRLTRPQISCLDPSTEYDMGNPASTINRHGMMI